MLGAFRYCVNEPDYEDAGKALFPVLMSMMWKREREGKTYVNECGLVFRPAKFCGIFLSYKNQTKRQRRANTKAYAARLQHGQEAALRTTLFHARRDLADRGGGDWRLDLGSDRLRTR